MRSTSNKAIPSFVEPMQPEMVSTLPSGRDSQYEVKWDGYRMPAVKTPKAVTLWSRNEKNHTARYPGVAAAVKALPVDLLLLDGELVALDSRDDRRFNCCRITRASAYHWPTWLSIY